MKKGMKETAEDKAVTKAALENAGATLLKHIEGVEEVLAYIADKKVLLADRYNAAKADGYDRKAVKAVVRRRAMTPDQKKAQGEFDLVVTTYEVALQIGEVREIFAE